MTGALETNVLIAHVPPQVHFHPGRAFPFAGARGELTLADAGMGAVSRGSEEGTGASACGPAHALFSERNLTNVMGEPARWAQPAGPSGQR
jgi:hypothetical protein